MPKITYKPGKMTPAQLLQPAMRFSDWKVDGKPATPQQFMNILEDMPVDTPRPNMKPVQKDGFLARLLRWR